MSNQNNTMINLELKSNVNLNRYKRKISDSLILNGCNMPVVGDKYAPMTKEYTTDDEYIYDDGENFVTYNRDTFGSSNAIKEYRPELRGYDFDGLIYDSGSVKGALKIESGSLYYYDLTTSELTKTKITGLMGTLYNKDKRLFCQMLANNYCLVSTDFISFIFDIRTKQSNYQGNSIYFYGLVTGIKDYVSSNNYTIYSAKSCYITGIGETMEDIPYFSIRTFRETVDEMNALPEGSFPTLNGNNRKDVLVFQTDGDTSVLQKFFTINGNGNNNDITPTVFTRSGGKSIIYYDLDSRQFRECSPRSTDSRECQYYLLNENLSESPYILDLKVERNEGFNSCISYKYGGDLNDDTDTTFKIFTVYKGGTHTFTSIENGKLKNNFIRFNSSFPIETQQGVNVMFDRVLGFDTVDYSKYSDKLNTGSDQYIKLKNGAWIRRYNNEYLEPLVLVNKIYSGENITVINEGTVRTEQNPLYSFIYPYLNVKSDFAKVFNSNEEWVSSARYMVFGVSSPITDALFTIQLSPFLAVYNDSVQSDSFLKNNKYFFIQKDIEDATLYNFYDETYTAPTDSDFYIPIVNSDRVDGSITNDIVITRLDGTTAKLIKYNNSFLSMYSYSGIEQNIEYTFIIQGQYYSVSDGVIVDGDGVGICCVEGMKYIGCNGSIALYFNERTKKIYSFDASNTLSELLSCDDIKAVLQTDLSNTNDEIYILYKNYDNISKLVCIENDGQCYFITEDADIVKFMIGTNAIYVWENVHGTVKAYGHRLITNDDIKADNNNYIETSYIGTGEFKMITIDRLYLRLVPVNKNGEVNSIVTTINYLTLDGEVSEQHIIENPTTEYFRISPAQKRCLGFSIRIDGLTNYTVSALSVGLTDDSNMVANDSAKPLVHDSKTFNVDMFD